MTKIVGIRFRNVGKIYYFDPKNYKMQVGDHVIVETARGVEFGRVVLGPKEVGEDEVVHPLKEVLRVATQADEDREKQNRLKEKDAFKICQKKIREHGLEMKLIDAEYTFDNNKVLFYFTADGRIDFRQLVKDLARSSRQELNCGRSESGMRPRFWEELESAADVSAAILISQSLHRYPSRWRRSRIFR